jgi:hypothetical membrane protein
MDISYLAAVFLSRFKYFGILASLITIIALVFPMPWYSGRNGERYSVLNHFVSELGEVGVSKAARVFNGGLILAGALFVPFIIGLGISMGNGWAKLGMVLGVWTAVSLILVGVFPMDKLEPHVRATLSFFNGGWLAIILFTLSVWTQPAGMQVLPRSMVWFGLLCTAVYSAFLLVGLRSPSDEKIADFLRPNLAKERPNVWLKPLIEWLVVILSILWYLSTALLIAVG